MNQSNCILVILLPLMVVIMPLFLAVFLPFLQKKFFHRKVKKNNGRWLNLDERLPPVDEEAKRIDGKYFEEGKYTIVASSACLLTITDKSLVRWVLRYMTHRRHEYLKAYTSNNIRGKLIYDRSHARAYIDEHGYAPDW